MYFFSTGYDFTSATPKTLTISDLTATKIRNLAFLWYLVKHSQPVLKPTDSGITSRNLSENSSARTNLFPNPIITSDIYPIPGFGIGNKTSYSVKLNTNKSFQVSKATGVGEVYDEIRVFVIGSTPNSRVSLPDIDLDNYLEVFRYYGY
jgi:hypothetical protein